ncbi:hypothetical protein [Mycoplasma procyoni]|uniref:hypothetical protein n=1 Tax=Mycoplasma procyoni TaxID=568784 RepID=UPI00197B8EA0|nr:hypothetical protein [Mycoplasma procyoni]MBN3534526.1 hypothetical protein [Mycoplasma procyoni]
MKDKFKKVILGVSATAVLPIATVATAISCNQNTASQQSASSDDTLSPKYLCFPV